MNTIKEYLQQEEFEQNDKRILIAGQNIAREKGINLSKFKKSIGEVGANFKEDTWTAIYNDYLICLAQMHEDYTNDIKAWYKEFIIVANQDIEKI